MERAAPLLARHGIVAAYVYGSRVSGRPRPESDLDVGYYLEPFPSEKGLSVRDEMLLEADLSDALEVSVDLRNLAGAPLKVRGRVLEDGRRIYSGDDVARVGIERDTLSRYHDYKAEFAAMHELRLKSVREKGL